jgi:hypothetical protein
VGSAGSTVVVRRLGECIQAAPPTHKHEDSAASTVVHIGQNMGQIEDAELMDAPPRQKPVDIASIFSLSLSPPPPFLLLPHALTTSLLLQAD